MKQRVGSSKKKLNKIDKPLASLNREKVQITNVRNEIRISQPMLQPLENKGIPQKRHGSNILMQGLVHKCW